MNNIKNFLLKFLWKKDMVLQVALEGLAPSHWKNKGEETRRARLKRSAEQRSVSGGVLGFEKKSWET